MFMVSSNTKFERLYEENFKSSLDSAFLQNVSHDQVLSSGVNHSEVYMSVLHVLIILCQCTFT